MGHLDQELPNLGVGSAVGEAESGQREQEKEGQDHHHDHADRETHPSRAGQSGGGGLFFATYTLWANRMCTFCRAGGGGGSCLLTRSGALELVTAEGKKDETKSAKE